MTRILFNLDEFPSRHYIVTKGTYRVRGTILRFTNIMFSMRQRDRCNVFMCNQAKFPTRI